MTVNQLLNTADWNPFVSVLFIVLISLCMYLLLGGIKWSFSVSPDGMFHMDFRLFFIPKSFSRDVDVFRKAVSKKTASGKSTKFSQTASAKKKRKNRVMGLISLCGFSLWNSRKYWYRSLKIKKIGWSHRDVEIYGKGCAVLAGLSGFSGLKDTDFLFNFDLEEKKRALQAEGLFYFGFFFVALFIFLTHLIRHKFINFKL